MDAELFAEGANTVISVIVKLFLGLIAVIVVLFAIIGYLVSTHTTKEDIQKNEQRQQVIEELTPHQREVLGV